MTDETPAARASTAASHPTLDAPTSAPPTVSPGRARVALVGIAIAALLVAGFGIVSRVRARTSLKSDTLKTAAPIVRVFVPEGGATNREIDLPGTTSAYNDSPIYARTNGYLKKWYVDIGARVKKGQTLADIDSPEIEQQLQQSKADLATAQANERLAKMTADRYGQLAKTDSVSKQDADSAAETLAARRAATLSALANVRRLEQMVSFSRIEAPFDGVITARNASLGQLVDAGSSGGPARELFHIATLDRLRVFVAVPQSDSAAAQAGVPVEIQLAQRPGRRYGAKIVRNASSIDPATGTLLTEIALDNPTGEILPGAAVQVHLKLDRGSPTLLLPVSALMFRAEGPRVATLASGGRAHLSVVTIGRDYGNRVEVTSGLAPGTPVIDSPPDSLIEGQAVQVAK